jgi:hypothetical protein
VESTDNNNASVTSVMPPKRKVGRPPSRNWDALKPELELLIRAGYGLRALARHYGASTCSVNYQLKRMGLSTVWQESEHGQG